MIGAVTIARIADDAKLSTLVLDETKKHLMALHPNIGKKKKQTAAAASAA
jgi:hypothetical protein